MRIEIKLLQIKGTFHAEMGEKWKKKLKTQLKYGIKNSGFNSEISYLKHYPSRRRYEDQNSKIIPYITN